MTQEETLKRIEERAASAAVSDFSIFAFEERTYMKAFIAGAKSERNKAIDDCIQVLETNPGDMNLVPFLKSLKLNE